MRLPWSKAPSRTGTAVFRLAAPLQPMHRGEHSEDPLEERLTEHKLGAIGGGGTQVSAEGVIEYCEIEVDLHVSPPDQAAAQIAQLLAAMGDAGRLLSWREGSETSDLFFYGADAGAIEAAAAPVLVEHPLGQNHQIERLT